MREGGLSFPFADLFFPQQGRHEIMPLGAGDVGGDDLIPIEDEVHEDLALVAGVGALIGIAGDGLFRIIGSTLAHDDIEVKLHLLDGLLRNLFLESIEVRAYLVILAAYEKRAKKNDAKHKTNQLFHNKSLSRS
jgi:hypothetical protein